MCVFGATLRAEPVNPMVWLFIILQIHKSWFTECKNNYLSPKYQIL